jgi:uncharacterized protein YjeT (DUF2065 family)
MPRRKNSAHHKNLFGAICMVTGVLLVMWGRNLVYSTGGQLRYLFTGLPNDQGSALVIGGGALIVIGVYLVFLQPD